MENFEELFLSNLKPGQKFVSYKCEKLLSAGENYGSIMLRVEVKILNEKNEEEIMHCVAKTCPPSELLWTIFNTKETFKKEIAVYTTIVPTLNDYAREKGIDNLLDFFAKDLGARISLDARSDTVDKDAVLLLENLMVGGYQVGDRFTGFNIETTKLLLNDLATLHAAPIAYKLEKPDEFKKKIRPYLKSAFNFPDDENFRNSVLKQLESAASKNPKCIPHLSKLKDGVLSTKNVIENPPKINELFATFTHNDYWVNNTLLKFENGKPIQNKMVDFQVIEYSSLAHDVLFFLYTSVELSVLENHLDELFRYYYDRFIGTLKRLGCDTGAYTFEKMVEEFGYIGKEQQFGHIIFMNIPILTLKGKVKEMDEFDLVDIGADESMLHENFFKRLHFVLLDFVKRKWI